MAKSKEELISMIENDLVDPSTNKITGERVKNALTEMVDAMGTGGGAMEYWKNGVATIPSAMAINCPIVKMNALGATQVVPGGLAYADSNASMLAVAFDRTYRFFADGEIVTMGDLLSLSGWDDSLFIQITEEEFYTIS
jgi:hypothetical protein